MASTFTEQLASSANLNDVERRVLDQAGVRSADDVDGLLRSFPSLVNMGVRMDIVSNAVAQQISAAYAAISSEVRARPPRVDSGQIRLRAAPLPAAVLSGLRPHQISRLLPFRRQASIFAFRLGLSGPREAAEHAWRLERRRAWNICNRPRRARTLTTPSSSCTGR